MKEEATMNEGITKKQVIIRTRYEWTCPDCRKTHTSGLLPEENVLCYHCGTLLDVRWPVAIHE